MTFPITTKSLDKLSETSSKNSQDITNSWNEEDFESLPMLPGNHSIKATFQLIRIYKKQIFSNSDLLKVQSLLIHSQYFRPILEDLREYSLKIYKFHQDNETGYCDIVRKMCMAILDFCENVVGLPTLKDNLKNEIIVNCDNTFKLTDIDSLGYNVKDIKKYEYEENNKYNEYNEYYENEEYKERYKYNDKEYKECKEYKEYKEYREYRECTRHNATQHEDLFKIEQESFVQIHDCLLFHLLNLRLRVVEIVDQDGIVFNLEQQIIKRCEKSKLGSS
ncbi:10848_t:CDS:1 [Scutellospora calospora]|uniref:10848_t:CDS:1 n=1 Tax=Scutellospora calospora TaxID=85575 RepID=A0ACA9M0M8_9GLOM|nr:10848_t:CDS:1 [Scutellospora calospora]